MWDGAEVDGCVDNGVRAGSENGHHPVTTTASNVTITATTVSRRNCRREGSVSIVTTTVAQIKI